MGDISLVALIDEGKEIRNAITFSHPPEGVMRLYSAYRIKDVPKFETWKNKTIRFLSLNFSGDRCINDFDKAVEEFSKTHNSPTKFDKLIGILESCHAIPVIPRSNEKSSDSTSPSINISVNQSQNQTQQQVITVKLLLESFKEHLTGKQFNEIVEVASTETDPTVAKSKIIDKIKSFGLDTMSNILASIISNPAIWSNLVQ